MSKFRLSPPAASKIVDEKLRAKRKEIAKAQKKAEKKATKKASVTDAAASKKAPKKVTKRKATEKALKKKAAPKRAAAAAAAPAPKKRGRPKKKTSGERPRKTTGKLRVAGRVDPAALDQALDFLLKYRSSNGAVSLDSAIVDLTLQSRAA